MKSLSLTKKLMKKNWEKMGELDPLWAILSEPSKRGRGWDVDEFFANGQLEIQGLMEGQADPDSEKCVEIATTAALKKMMLPGVIAVSMPAIVGFGLGAQALGGMLAGGLLGCVSLALMMANAGGAWDNAKKFVEKGNFGGKGSETHAAAVVGDTVGDPFKDTSGPSMNILINVMAIVSLVIAPLLSI